MKIDILTLFPQMFDGVFQESIIKRAIDDKKVEINLVNFRDYTIDSHNKVDDTPYGGGAGMVLSCQPIFDCIRSLQDDERIKSICDMFISVGDYILTGGEIPAMVLVDSITRLIPGVINEQSHIEDSFNDNFLLDYPSYTKPRVYEGMEVPEVLISGDHKKIDEYRHQESLRITRENRPDLLEK